MFENDIIGKKFGNLLVLEDAESYIWRSKKTNKLSYRRRVLCICDCGGKKITEATKLRNKSVKQCTRCAYANRKQSLRRLSEEQRWFNLHIRSRTLSGISVNITVEEAVSCARNPCYYCDSKPYKQDIYKGKFSKSSSLVLNGIDRINSTVGYKVNNIVPCCPKCNFMKSTHTQEEFFSHMEKILRNIGRIK